MHVTLTPTAALHCLLQRHPQGPGTHERAALRPLWGCVDDVHVIGADQGVFSQTHNGLAVVGKTVQLKPGQRVVIDCNLLTGKGQPGIPVLRVTPVTLGKDVIGASSGCSWAVNACTEACSGNGT